jgi:hypothetical protein
MKRTRAVRSALVLCLATAGAAHAQAPMGSAFTYQGRLADAGVPASGSFDFRFALFDAATGGSAVGAPVSIPAVAVTGGLFTVALDFGPAAFAGQARWLQVEVRPAGGGGYTALTPRQELTPAPHAGFSSRTDPANLTALNASNLTSGVVPDARLAGAYGQPLGLTNAANALTGTFTGNGAGLTALVASNLATGTVPGGVVAGTYPNALTLPNPANVLAGDGSALTNLNAQPRLVRTLVVGPVGTPADNGTALLAALASITTAGPSNPWVLKVEPGFYSVAPGALVMKPYVDLEGSGERTTTILAIGSANNATGTLRTADNAAVRDVAIHSTGGAAYSKAVYVNGTSPTLLHVTAAAFGATAENQGIFVDVGATTANAPLVGDCTISAFGTGTANSYGFLAIGAVFPRVERTTSTGQGGNFATAYWNFQSNSTLVAVRGYAYGAAGNVALASVSGQNFVTDSELTAYGAVSYGASGSAGSFIGIHRSLVSAENVGALNDASSMIIGRSQVGSFASGGLGLQNVGTTGAFTVSIDASDVYGSGRTISNSAPFTILVGGTKLNGPLPSGGTRTCVASYTGAYTPVSATCN